MKRLVTIVGPAVLAACAGNGEVPQQGETSSSISVSAAPAESHRRTLNFNTHWLFAGDVPGQNGQVVSAQESSEASFVPVTLPYFRLHPHKGFGKIDFEVPVSWYRRHFTLPSEFAGRRIAVEFQGVAKIADVYVNGTWVGQHKGSYTSFTFDVTDLVHLGGQDNVIAVKVDSTEHGDIPPEGGAVDYYVWGGIVRDVNLVVTDPLHADTPFVSTVSVANGSATVRARTNVRNDGDTAKTATVSTSLVDAGGQVVGTGSATLAVPPHGAKEFSYDISVSSPKLWHPDNPYLYTARTQVGDGAALVDERNVRVGIRSIEFRRSDGKFYLNGQWLKLRGLDRHEQYPYIGRAAPNRLQAKDADILKYELGINIVRTSHYPQDPEFLDRTDEIGLLVLEEIPGWQHIGDANWKNISIQNVEEMVTRDRHHPSIVTWGVRINESGDDHDFYVATNAKARALDPSRPTCGVRNFRNSEFLEDLYTYNDFSGTAQDPAVLPWLITESVGHTKPHQAWDPESTLIGTMQTHLNVQNTAAAKANISGAMGWAAFDYNTTFNTGASCHDATCYHGVSDIFRLPKFSASAFSSQRDPAKYGPYVSIDNYWMSSSANLVYVAGNCDQVELFANGASKGKIGPNAYTSLPHPFFQFNNVTYAAGSLRADCWIGGSIAKTATQYTPGAATKLALSIDDGLIQADGADMTRVVVRALDAHDQAVPYDASKVTFAVTGPGALIGESPLTLEAGRGAVYLKSALGKTGNIGLTASAPGLTAASVSVNATPFVADIVPAGGAYGFGFVNDVNDSAQGTAANRFNYVGSGWRHGGCAGGCFSGDNSWDNVANETVTLAFRGQRVVLYGVYDTIHGTAAVSIDGGAETDVSLKGPRRGNVAVWTSPTLPEGNHTLKVRVKGDGYVVIDRAMVVSTGPTLLVP
ncbi:DUF4982 domain-containing protein [Pendulispora brunnea]|uniref:DUF4982 domain-containing protein n=1 Tax=Pendulispora brunnea TaxID=2905690 RepID=A0ABZ2JX32_9BACT